MCFLRVHELVTPVIDIKNFSCERDDRVLFAGLDLNIFPGDIVQIEGPNGIGKTTLLRSIAGLYADYSGDILWQGESLSKSRTYFAQNLLYIGHLPGIKKTLTVRENLLFLASLNHPIPSTDIERYLSLVGLEGYEDVLAVQLSAGQLRRVALARLYASSASVWVLDEPYTAIDKQGIVNLERLFIQHCQQGGVILMTSHQSPNLDNLKIVSLVDYQSLPTD